MVVQSVNSERRKKGFAETCAVVVRGRDEEP
jgi:hypothetical protein